MGFLSLLSGLRAAPRGAWVWLQAVTRGPEAAPQPPCADFHVGSGSLAASEPFPWAETSVRAGPSQLDGESGTGSAAWEGPVLCGSPVSRRPLLEYRPGGSNARGGCLGWSRCAEMLGSGPRLALVGSWPPPHGPGSRVPLSVHVSRTRGSQSAPRDSKTPAFRSLSDGAFPGQLVPCFWTRDPWLAWTASLFRSQTDSINCISFYSY